MAENRILIIDFGGQYDQLIPPGAGVQCVLGNLGLQ